jgi:hypothetical protein
MTRTGSLIATGAAALALMIAAAATAIPPAATHDPSVELDRTHVQMYAGLPKRTGL